MIELVLAPGKGQFSVHTPFIMRQDKEIYLFYARADYPAEYKNMKFAKEYKIYYGVSKDGKEFDLHSDPILERSKSVCRPSVIEQDGHYLMYFVWTLPDAIAMRFRICRAVSKDLKSWNIDANPVIENFRNCQHVASPNAIKVNGKIRIYFSGAGQHRKGDRLYMAESADGEKFTVENKPFYQPGKSSGQSYYTPYVYPKGNGWEMLFSVLQASGRFTTFAAGSPDGVNFEGMRPMISLDNDARFARGAYKAQMFEDYVYFVGQDSDERSSIYRVPAQELPL